jgi:hypothetical protein
LQDSRRFEGLRAENWHPTRLNGYCQSRSAVRETLSWISVPTSGTGSVVITVSLQQAWDVVAE